MVTEAMQKVWGFLEQEGYLEAYRQFYSCPNMS
mgnify:CR=1 FL=1